VTRQVVKTVTYAGEWCAIAFGAGLLLGVWLFN
jgi:hypothetical protein